MDDVLKKLAPLRNQLLVFSILGSVLLGSFGTGLMVLDEGNAVTYTCGSILLCFIPVILLMGMCFYFYVWIKSLPSSEQESRFNERTAEMMREHKEMIAGAGA